MNTFSLAGFPAPSTPFRQTYLARLRALSVPTKRLAALVRTLLFVFFVIHDHVVLKPP
jgi:hypothetical protein